MMRFIDLGKQIAVDETDPDYPRQFAFYDTIDHRQVYRTRSDGSRVGFVDRHSSVCWRRRSETAGSPLGTIARVVKGGYPSRCIHSKCTKRVRCNE